jgi:hypothetical protein
MEAPMKTFTVIYRTGGTENFKWNRKRAEEAEAQSSSGIERLKNVEQALRLFSASSALGLSEKNSILSTCDELRKILVKEYERS